MLYIAYFLGIGTAVAISFRTIYVRLVFKGQLVLYSVYVLEVFTCLYVIMRSVGQSRDQQLV